MKDETYCEKPFLSPSNPYNNDMFPISDYLHASPPGLSAHPSTKIDDWCMRSQITSIDKRTEKDERRNLVRPFLSPNNPSNNDMFFFSDTYLSLPVCPPQHQNRWLVYEVTNNEHWPQEKMNEETLVRHLFFVLWKRSRRIWKIYKENMKDIMENVKEIKENVKKIKEN